MSRSEIVAGRGSIALPILLSLLVGALAITNESLWIDEANSALKAMQPSLTAWWHFMASEKGSDLQMPLYMFYLWCWEKIAGHSEFWLRAANVPWLLLANVSIFRMLRRSGVNPLPFLLIASLNPFLWFYLNEARPYVMQYAAASVLGALLFQAATDSVLGIMPSSLWLLATALLVLCGSSLLGVIWAAFAGVAWLYLVRDRFRPLLQPARLFPLAVMAGGLAVLGAYYLWTIKVGGRASDIGRTSLLNVGFVFYELLGLAGLGPGRLEIRQAGLASFRALGALLLPLSIGFALSVGLLAAATQRAWALRSRAVLAGCLYAIPPTLLLFALAYAQNFRVLGRHFMPLLPVIIALFASAIWGTRRHRLKIILVSTLIAFWLGSSLSLRLAGRHRKDDYRTAAAIAKNGIANNKIVWWSADTSSAAYYKVPLEGMSPSNAHLVIAPTSDQLINLPLPDLVVASKPDIYDPAGTLGSFLRDHSFTAVRELPAFRIWRQPSPPH